MVTHSRTPLRTDRLRALNRPVPVAVKTDEQGLPVVVMEGIGDGREGAREGEEGRDGEWRVDAIGEVWRVHDEWWRTLINRRYVEVVLDGGKHVMLFEDLETGEWCMQSI